MWLSQVAVYSRLHSNLFGALIQSVEVVALALAADAAAGRVYAAPDRLPATYASNRQLAVSSGQMSALHDWPRDPGALFEVLRDQSPPRHVFRAHELTGHGAGSADGSLFGQVESVAPVVDSLCTWVAIAGEAWAAIAFLRCGTSHGFSSSFREALDQYHPAVARRLREGYHHDLAQTPRGPARRTASGGDRPTEIDLYRRLSETEQRVFECLCQGMTERHIAETMHRSRHTVHVHVKSIYRKLNVRSRAELQALIDKA